MAGHPVFRMSHMVGGLWQTVSLLSQIKQMPSAKNQTPQIQAKGITIESLGNICEKTKKELD